VANDAVTIVVNRRNDWARCLTAAELRKIWAPRSAVASWNDVRPEFPDEPLELYGPAEVSGTFEYFTGAIVGTEGASRTDYLASEDHNQIVQDVIAAEGGLGYFGLPNFNANRDHLKALEIDAGPGCVAPTIETAQSGEYPLSRALFVYAKNEALRTPHVRAFVEYALDSAIALARDSLLVPLTSEQLRQERATFSATVAELAGS
jgi:phosphate transport system substrate-binding protein